MKTKLSILIVAAFACSFGVAPLSAQLVADGATASINAASTNITGDLIIGTNGSFSTLIITNAGAVTNTGNGIIGQNSSARTNRVTVTSANSVWNIGGNLNFGVLGAFGQLIVTNGGRVENNIGNMAFNGGSSNTVTVAGSDSVWTNRSGLNIGNSGGGNQVLVTHNGTLGSGGQINVGNQGASNQLVVAAGGKVFGDVGRLGNNLSSLRNLAVVADAGSQWRARSELTVGASSSFNHLYVTNGGKVVSVGAFVGASLVQGGTGHSNLVVIADAGSTWTNSTTSAVGNSGSFNQLILTNGGMMVASAAFDGTLTLGTHASSTNNLLLVSGANSLFANQDSFVRQVVIGFSGSHNQLLVNGGGAVETGSGFLGFGAASSNNTAHVADAGSRWLNSAELSVGNSGSFNHLTVSNAALVSAPNLFVGAGVGASNNSLTIAGGNVIVTNAAGNGLADTRRGAVTLHSGLLLTDRLLLTNGSQTQFAFNGGAVQTRNTTVSHGSVFSIGDGSAPATFELLGSGTHTFANGVLVADNATLKGNGTISGPVTVSSGGRLVPGASIGAMVLSNAPTLQGAVIMELGKNGAALTNDQVRVHAPLVYGGSLLVSNLGPTALAGGDSFTLFSATSYGGAFDPFGLPALPSGLMWTNRLLINGSIQVVPFAPPRFSSIALSGTNLLFSGAGGAPDAAFRVLSTTNVALPLTNWSPVLSNQFDWLGNFTFTRPVSLGEPHRFFVLQVP